MIINNQVSWKQTVLILNALVFVLIFGFSFQTKPTEYSTGYVTMFECQNYLNCKSKKGFKLTQVVNMGEGNIFVIMEK